ncbi:glutamate-ammonia-ligase adenylyltransferase [Desulfacinum hydrothermale DSM 13146]|uniref:Glutamate-ammonia-ligase adenylyltransferase n=1 Tax=Desulfacinum hydrothermale DSM 13146 TaxID=1121390 RepID=A0A1W1XV29_9BACT|nr:hypothetical protein [Desulfacinum hydrothermale]SMC27747.1 glutamate-ammonia-ligase adenylyltransferase [Desulfacinum hydrothermale DSM 13146]
MEKELERIHHASAYLSTLLRRQDYRTWLWDAKNLWRRYGVTELFRDLSQDLDRASSFHDVLRCYRSFKQRHFLRIGGRDLLGWADLEETTGQISDLAQVCLQVGLEWLKGHPHTWVPEAQRESAPALLRSMSVVVLGLGKLGGRELNYVSDVDLLFLRQEVSFDESESADASRLTALLCQKLVQLLADPVEGDRVFHVDLRLRPQGKDGELVPTAGGAAYHYLLQGKAWERQMLLKARPVAGDRGLGASFLKEIRPFVFRRFLDFQALDELKAMRDRILFEGVSRTSRRGFDVKLGTGGIREVEFLVQSFQLIYGGRHPQLEEPNTLKALRRLQELDLLPSGAARELQDAYVFLRRVEHWVQLDQNRQTQELPASDEGRRRLASALGFQGHWDRFLLTLQGHCRVVHQHFTALFSGPDQADSETESVDGAADGIGDLRSWLERQVPSLAAFPGSFVRGVEEGVLPYVEAVDDALRQTMAARVDRYLAQVCRRPGLQKFLAAQTRWVPVIMGAVARCKLVADMLEHQPGLVETLAQWDDRAVSHEHWRSSARSILVRTTAYDETFEWLRRLKNERLLMVALEDLSGTWSHPQVEAALSDLADFVIQETLHTVCAAVELSDQTPLAVLALGKLGSREMDYLSDLDLMFVYEPLEGEAPDQIPMPVVRLMHRFMRMLTTPLQEGPGYQVDARLRPTGTYGPLAVTRANWEDYYANRADIWEIQALLRLRAVAGPRKLQRELMQQAADLCYQPRRKESVWPRLAELRRRMEEERTSEKKDVVDLKLGPGGMADVEFLVQGAQLLYGHAKEELRRANVREALAEAARRVLEDEETAHKLTAAFQVLRSLEHRLHLMTHLGGGRISRAQLEHLVRLRLWPPPGLPLRLDTWEDLLALRRFVRRQWQVVCRK